MHFDNFIMSHIHHYRIVIVSPRIVFPPQKSPVLDLFFPLPLPQTTDNWDLFTLCVVSLFPECQIGGIAHYVVFSHWLFLHSSMYLKFLQVFWWLFIA